MYSHDARSLIVPRCDVFALRAVSACPSRRSRPSGLPCAGGAGTKRRRLAASRARPRHGLRQRMDAVRRMSEAAYLDAVESVQQQLEAVLRKFAARNADLPVYVDHGWRLWGRAWLIVSS